MSTKSDIPAAVRSAARRFHSNRADYYRYIANLLEATNGNKKISDILEADASRYAGKPRGTLSAYWAETYMANGASLSGAWKGTLPNDEVSVIGVAEEAGAGAICPTLQDLSRTAAIGDEIKKATIGAMFGAGFGLALALVMGTVFLVFAAGSLRSTYAFLPLDAWGPMATGLLNHAERVRTYGWMWVTFVVVLVVAFQWSVANFVGPMRDWMDRNLAIYKTLRDTKGAMFLSTMATLTRKRGNVMFTLGQSVERLSAQTVNPWLKWRLAEVADRITVSGGTGKDMFRTQLISEDMYYFLQDTIESKDVASGFAETGRYVESTVVNEIKKRLKLYSYVMLGIGVTTVLTVNAWQMAATFEMKGAMDAYYSSGR